MKKVLSLVFVGSLLTFAACQSKPKTEETSVDSTSTMMSTDTTTMMDSASTMAGDSATMMPADSAK